MISQRIKILLILPSLKAGGAERVISFLASHLDDQKFDCRLIVIGYKKDAVYSTKNINTTYLNRKRVLHALFPLFVCIFRSKPHIVLGSISHVNRILALFSIYFKSVIFVGREANVSSAIKQFSKSKKFSITRLIFRNYLNKLNVIICQSQDMAIDLKKIHKLDERNLVIINNPITDSFKAKDKVPFHSKKSISYITVGSLHERKGHLRLLNLLSKVDHEFKYTIIGEGPEINAILLKSKELQIRDHINYIKYTDKVAEHLKQSDLFLNGSYTEGFPNAILESCSVGTPVLAFEAPGGLNEIIVDHVNGYLVKNENEFISKLNTINALYHFEPDEVSNSVRSKYGKDIILRRYEDLFLNLTKKP